MAPIRYRTADVDGFKVFYREAGQANAPRLLLLHGFPSAGHMFRDLIPLLADRFHIVAPDLPGFGQSDMPPREKFRSLGFEPNMIAELINQGLATLTSSRVYSGGKMIEIGLNLKCAPRNGISERLCLGHLRIAFIP
jgi:hypothetical protein